MANSKPTKEHELPQGRKNWDKTPQQVDGPEGPVPTPTPEDAGAGETNSRKKPQQVQAKGSGVEVQEPAPDRHARDDVPVPQQIDGPEGPVPTDGTELIAAVEKNNSPAETRKGGPVEVKASKGPNPVTEARTADHKRGDAPRKTDPSSGSVGTASKASGTKGDTNPAKGSSGSGNIGKPAGSHTAAGVARQGGK